MLQHFTTNDQQTQLIATKPWNNNGGNSACRVSLFGGEMLSISDFWGGFEVSRDVSTRNLAYTIRLYGHERPGALLGQRQEIGRRLKKYTF